MFRGEYAAFNTGLVDKLYRSLYALFRVNSKKEDAKYQLIDFCIANRDFLREFWDPPKAAEYVKELGEVILDPDCEIQPQWHHVIIDAIAKARYPV